MMKLFLVNCRQPVVNAFREMGCVVEAVRVGDRVYDVPAALDRMDYEPDAIIQQENLGARVFLQGLSALSCLKLFWSVDTHLNLHWHVLYARLFDAVLTTQKKYVQRLEKSGVPVYWMPWMGVRPGLIKGVKPYEARRHDMTFVGRVSRLRPSRQWFTEFLSSRYKLNMQDGLGYSKMMQTYRDTRIVPNEAIFNEVNFRLFEAASCACSVVTPDVGEELDELFERGEEIEVYSNVLELKDILDKLSREHKYAERLALRGYARVLRDHLPENRGRKILEIMDSLGKRSFSGRQERRINALVQAALYEAGDKSFACRDICGWLSDFSGDDSEVDAALMRLYSLDGNCDKVLELAGPYLAGSAEARDVYPSMSFSISCSRCGFWDAAKFFWYNYCEKRRVGAGVKPDSEDALFILWAKELFKAGEVVRSGVLFKEDRDIPCSAVDCLSAALHISPGNLEIYRLMALYLDKVDGGQAMRLGFLSHLSLHFPDDWRVALDLALVSLESFRLEQGLAELDHAAVLAASAGEAKTFKRLVGYRNLPLPVAQKSD